MKFTFGTRKNEQSVDWRAPYRLCDDPKFGVEEAPPAGLDPAETGEAIGSGRQSPQHVEPRCSHTSTEAGSV